MEAVLSKPGTRTALALALAAVLTVAVGLIGKAAGLNLGAPLQPFFAYWEPAIDPAAIWALPALGLALAASIPLIRGAGGTLAFIVGVIAIALLGRLALAAAREGTMGWYSVFGLDPEAGNEYLPALPALDSLGLAAFLDRFAELSPTLPIHPSAHPPGLLLLLDLLGIDGPRGMATLVIGVATLIAPLTYVLARNLALEEWRARAAALLVALSPGAMIYGATSPDAMFATLATAAVCLLVASGPIARAIGAATLVLASFFSWALLAGGAFAAIVLLLREGIGSALKTALMAGVLLFGAYITLHAATGFDPLGSIRAAGEAYDLGISNARPYLYWLFGSPVAFFVALGLPISWYAARALGTGNEVAIGLVAIVAVSVLVGLTKAENERIWLFMAPLAAVAAASILPRRAVPPVLALLVAQAVAAELLLDTIW